MLDSSVNSIHTLLPPTPPGSISVEGYVFSKYQLTSHKRVKPTRNVKSVRFDELATVYSIPGRQDYTKTEVVATWLNREDYREMEREAASTLRQLPRGSLSMDDSNGDEIQSARGLENWINRERIKRNRKAAMFFVLGEQARQHKQTKVGFKVCKPDERIRIVYKSVADHCHRRAREMGRMDALVVRRDSRFCRPKRRLLEAAPSTDEGEPTVVSPFLEADKKENRSSTDNNKSCCDPFFLPDPSKWLPKVDADKIL